MDATYAPQEGIPSAMSINGQLLRLDAWDWQGDVKITEAPAFGTAYMDYTVNKKRGTIAFSGTWNRLYNPFTGPGFKLGNRVPVILYINSFVKAASGITIIKTFNASANSDGSVTVSGVLIPDGAFNDFSQTPA